MDSLLYDYLYINYKNNNRYLEILFVWIPVLIIILLLIPTLYYLYDLNYIYDTVWEVKAVGVSWNWIISIN